MKQINTLIPFLETEFKDVFDFVTSKGTPSCLYTYETCNACYSPNASLYVRDEENSKENYSLMKKVVTEVYGNTHMDNKITLRYIIDMWDLYDEVPIYITCWDGRISISTDVYFFRDIDGANSYRVVKPYMEDKSFKGYWYTDKNGNASHSWDFEQSIGE